MTNKFELKNINKLNFTDLDAIEESETSFFRPIGYYQINAKIHGEDVIIFAGQLLGSKKSNDWKKHHTIVIYNILRVDPKFGIEDASEDLEWFIEQTDRIIWRNESNLTDTYIEEFFNNLTIENELDVKIKS